MSENKDLEQNLPNESELSYEEEQLQQILLQESEKRKIEMDRELREAQEKEYQECIEKDTKRSQNECKSHNECKPFDEPSLDEMRRIRLERFEIN